MSDEFTIGPKLPGSEQHVAVKHTDEGDRPCVVGVVRDGEDLRQHSEVYQFGQKKGGRYPATKIWERPGPAQVATDAYRDNYDKIFN